MPDPPIPGGAEITEWWRIIGLIAVTVLTTGILALIFRPAVPATDVEPESDVNGQAHGAPGGLFTLPPLRRAGDPRSASVIPFPAGAETVDSGQSSEAAAERLRRLAARGAKGQAEETGERRRLGSGLAAREQDAAADGGAGATDADVAAEGVPGQSGSADDSIVAGQTQTGAGEDEMFGTPDTQDLLGDVADRLPSQADRVPDPAGHGAGQSGAKQPVESALPSSHGPEDVAIQETPLIMHGPAPTAADVDRMVETPPPGKIVQFVPRSAQQGPADIDPVYELLNQVEREQKPQPETVLTQFPVDLTTREDVTAIVQELLFCANVGEFLHGFALYTDRFLFKFMDQSGLNEDEFRERFSSVEPKDPADWTRVASIQEFRRLEDGRISAHVQYVDGGTLNGVERYVFKRDPITNRWLIDDITAVS